MDRTFGFGPDNGGSNPSKPVVEKRMKKRTKFLMAVATLTGTIIGAGILGIPYVVAKSGFITGAVHILALGLILLYVNLALGEVALRTKGEHQLAGYSGIYLGRTGKFLMFFSMFFGIYAALIAYIIGVGESLSFILFSSLDKTISLAIFFWIVMAVFVACGLKTMGKGEIYGVAGIVAVVLIVLGYLLPKISAENLLYLNPAFSFLPYGVIFFAYLGFSAIPELEQELRSSRKLMKKAILTGTIIPIIVYFLFAFAVVGFSGGRTSEIATLGLGKIASFFAIFAMFTSFYALSYALRTMYEYDFKMNMKTSWFLTLIPPVITALLILVYNLATFTQILGIAGGISGGVGGILVLLMLRKAKKKCSRKPEFTIKLPLLWLIFLIILFALGIVYQFL